MQMYRVYMGLSRRFFGFCLEEPPPHREHNGDDLSTIKK